MSYNQTLNMNSCQQFDDREKKQMCLYLDLQFETSMTERISK